jgi:hypothetical protein
MAGLTKKHIEKIAEIIKKHGDSANQIIVYNSVSPFLKDLAEYFKTQNPKFDEKKFKNSCLN